MYVQSITYVCTNAIQMYYNVCMSKISKTFRLSSEAVKVLEQQENQSKYIENLILGIGKLDEAAKHDDTIATHIYALEERLIAALKCPHPNVGPEKNTSSATNKNSSATPMEVRPADILNAIRSMEDELKEELEYAQDPEYIKEKTSVYKEEIDKLWAQYHALKAQEESDTI